MEDLDLVETKEDGDCLVDAFANAYSHSIKKKLSSDTARAALQAHDCRHGDMYSKAWDGKLPDGVDGEWKQYADCIGSEKVRGSLLEVDGLARKCAVPVRVISSGVSAMPGVANMHVTNDAIIVLYYDMAHTHWQWLKPNEGATWSKHLLSRRGPLPRHGWRGGGRRAEGCFRTGS